MPNFLSVLIVLKCGLPGTLGIEVIHLWSILGFNCASKCHKCHSEKNTFSQIGSDGSSVWRVSVV